MHFYRAIINVNVCIHVHSRLGRGEWLCRLWSAPSDQEGLILVRSPLQTSCGLKLGCRTTCSCKGGGQRGCLVPGLLRGGSKRERPGFVPRVASACHSAGVGKEKQPGWESPLVSSTLGARLEGLRASVQQRGLRGKAG